MNNKTMNKLAVSKGYNDWEELTISYAINGDITTSVYLSFLNEAINLIQEEFRKTNHKDRQMYKECLEMYLPTDKWDEANMFLSTYGNGVAKSLAKREL